MSADLDVKEAQEELREIVKALKGSRFRLLGVLESLLKSAAELDRLSDVDSEADLATEIRTVIQCVLTDSFRPLITDLQAMSELRAREAGQEDEEKE